jgi:colanic acid biosynthesis glycosyl transferase WcaI
VRVLLFAQHYAPEVTAARFRIESFAEGLVAAGHEVTVVCPVPNHPKGRVAEGYRGRPWLRRRVGQVDVLYVWVHTRPEKTTATRLAYYGSYAAAATTIGTVLGRPDVVLASSPPLTVGAVGALVAARFRCPFAFDVRDLWPESAVTLGELTNPKMIARLERLESWLYRKADLILTANDAFSRTVRETAPEGKAVKTIFNGTTSDWVDATSAQVPRSEVGLGEDDFVWAYAGNLGLAQSLDTALEAAALLGDGHRLLVVGEGPRKAELVAKAAELPPGTVEFRDLVDPPRAARILRASDVLLVAERQDKTVSAKLYDYAAVGRPIVAVTVGEMQRVVERTGIALRVAPGDAAGLAAALRRVRSEGDLAQELVARSAEFAAEHLRSRQAEILVGELEQLAGRPAPAL